MCCHLRTTYGIKVHEQEIEHFLKFIYLYFIKVHLFIKSQYVKINKYLYYFVFASN